LEFEPLSLLAAVLVTATALALLMTADWRLSIGLLAVQYVGVFLLVIASWPMAMAGAKLIAGWMAGAVLGMAILSVPELRQTSDRQDQTPQSLVSQPPATRTRQALSRAFYGSAAILVGLTILSSLPKIIIWIPGLSIDQAWGGLILIGLGLLKLGFTDQPLPTILGLLTTLAGFETLYATVQSSALVAGLLAGITLALALSGAYLLVTPHMEETD
jgi:hypothetical protein